MNDYTAPPQGLLEQDVENAWLELKPADDTDAMHHILFRVLSDRRRPTAGSQGLHD